MNLVLHSSALYNKLAQYVGTWMCIGSIAFEYVSIYENEFDYDIMLEKSTSSVKYASERIQHVYVIKINLKYRIAFWLVSKLSKDQRQNWKREGNVLRIHYTL